MPCESTPRRSVSSIISAVVSAWASDMPQARRTDTSCWRICFGGTRIGPSMVLSPTSRAPGSQLGDVDSPALGRAPGDRVGELHVAHAVLEVGARDFLLAAYRVDELLLHPPADTPARGHGDLVQLRVAALRPRQALGVRLQA